MRLREIMSNRVVTIGPDETASAAWTRMRRRDIRHLVVTDGSQLVGVISERDLGGRTGARIRKGRRVRDLMTRRVTSASPDMPLDEAADLMRSALIGSLPVVDDGELVGIVTATDVFDALGRDRMGALSRAERALLRAPSSSRRLGGTPARRVRGPGAAPGTRGQRALGVGQPEPLAASVPRSRKRAAGRTGAAETPVNIRVTGVTLAPDEREYVRERLGARLGKYATSIERVSVRVRDVNGPRGGVDKACHVKVVLSGLPSVVFEHQAASLRAAVTGALGGVERAVRRTVERRRQQPLRAATGGARSRAR